MRVTAAGDTHIGRREHNEDAVLIRRELDLYAMADGAGGENAGNVASSLAMTTLAHRFEQMRSQNDGVSGGQFDVLGLPTGAKQLSSAVHEANREIVALAANSDRYQGMGTTIVAMYVETDVGVMHIAHIGDSRCYRLRGGHLELLTQDHSLANDVLELAPDLASDRAAKLPSRVVTRALGMAPTVRVSMQSVALAPGDRYLACSDGLTDQLEEEQIADALRQNLRPENVIRLLMDVAQADKAADNIAVVIIDIGGQATDWPQPTLRGRPEALRSDESEYPEMLVVGEEADEDAPTSVRPVISVSGDAQSPSEPPKVVSVGAALPTKALKAVQELMEELPPGARPGAERDPTLRFTRRCPKCGQDFSGAADSCPNCWTGKTKLADSSDDES